MKSELEIVKSVLIRTNVDFTIKDCADKHCTWFELCIDQKGIKENFAFNSNGKLISLNNL